MTASDEPEVHDQEPASTLSRTLGFWALTIYGIGDILGAGIYALVGQVAAEAGTWSPLSFAVAMAVAGLTGLTYAELVARHPRSGGEASFCLEAFGRPRLAFLVGWLVFCSGVVSMATVTHACGNYTHAIRPEIPEWTVWIAFLVIISLVNFWGIRQSSLANIVFTLVEASGLVLVIVAGLMFVTREGIPADVAAQPVPPLGPGALSAAALAFYAYIGFEDMINVAEEVRDPQRVFPRAIVTAVLVCGLMYAAVCVVALRVLPLAELGQAEAPLVEIVRRAAPAVPPTLFTLIALIAVANTGLLNGIMASRLIYGMSRQGLLPAWLGAVHERTRTPHRAVLSIFLVALVLVFSGTLTRLAETTSLLLLVVFATVNASAIRLKWQQSPPPAGFRVPLVVPVLGILTCLGLGAFVSIGAVAVAGVVAGIGVLLMLLMARPRD